MEKLGEELNQFDEKISIEQKVTRMSCCSSANPNRSEKKRRTVSSG